VLHVLDHGHDAKVLDVAFSHDGERLVSASSDGSIRIWDATSFEPTLPPLVGHSGRVFSIAISGDGRWIASGGDDCIIRLWDASKGSEVLPPFVGHKSGIRSLAFSPDGTRIVSGSWDKTVRVWNAISGSQIAILLGHANEITAVSFSQDGTRIVSCSYNDSIRLWDATSGASVRELLKCKNTSATISPNGEWIVCCWMSTVGPELRIWNTVTGVEDRIIPLSGCGFCYASFFPDGRHIAAASNRHVHTWDIITGHHISSIEVHQLSGCMTLSPNGDRVAVGLLRNCTIGVWNTERNFVLQDATTSKITKSSSLPNAQHASSSSQKPSIPTMEGHTDYISCIIFSPNGNFIASGSHDNTICVWDAATGAQMLTLRGHEDIICCVAFSNDGTQIVSGSSDGVVRLWNASSGAQLLPPLRGHKKYLVSVAFSPGGKRIVSACYGHKICIWDTITGAKILRLWMPESIDLVRYFSDELLEVFHHNRSKGTRTSSIWSISCARTVVHETSCLCAKIIMAPTVVRENGSIVDLPTAKIIGKFPSIVSIKKYAVSNTSIAFTSDDRWSTMFILHFPHTILSTPGNIDDGEASDDGNVNEECSGCQMSDNCELTEYDSGNEECGCQMSDNCELIEYDSREDSEEDESDDDESGLESREDDNDTGPRLVRVKPGKHMCGDCRERF
jgi:WD40 repeat protein